MNQLIKQCVNFMAGSGFSFHICGGYALELFINQTIRPHSDLDMGLFEEDKEAFIKFMRHKGWIIYEPLKNGFQRLISNPDEQKVEQICAFCIKPDCSLIQMEPQDDNLFKMKILHPEQVNFDFIEVIFNPKAADQFIYAQNHTITRDLHQAISHTEDGIPYLSPELVLFCKSKYIARDGYQTDFDITVPFLSLESKEWLIKALETSYPDGHPWLAQLIPDHHRSRLGRGEECHPVDSEK